MTAKKEMKTLGDYLMHGDLTGVTFRDNHSNELYRVNWIRPGLSQETATHFTMMGRQDPSGKELTSSVLSIRLDDLVADQ